MIVVHVQLDSSTISPGKAFFAFKIIIFAYIIRGGGFMEIKEIKQRKL
jgi:hypothetical protein